MLRTILIVFFLLTILPSCSTMAYYSQSTSGHLSIWWQKEPIKEIVNTDDLDPQLKSRLQLVLEIREFATYQLRLPDNDSYRSYTDIQRPYVVWNVFAAPEFSLQPKKWCYLIVGCVSYRGYYTKQEAQQHADELAAQKLDTIVRGVPAYSTLGWFDDPVLNTFIHWPEHSLAGLIFHELSHQLTYIKGATEINEAYASSVQRLGVLQWLKQKGTQDQVDAYLLFLKRQTEFRQLLIQTRTELQLTYDMDIPDNKKRQRKKLIFDNLKASYAEIKKSWGGKDYFEYWFKTPMNNAKLTSNLTYLENIPAFFAFFKEAAGDWELFHQRVAELEALDEEKRSDLMAEYIDRNIDLELLIEQNFI